MTLKIAGVMVSSSAIGSGLGITFAVLGRKPLREIELWGFRGTAGGCGGGVFLTVLLVVLS